MIVNVKELVPGNQVILQGKRPSARKHEDYTVLSVHKSSDGGHAYADDAFENRNWHPISFDKDDSFLCTVVSVALLRMLSGPADLKAPHDSFGMQCYPDDAAVLLFVTGVSCTQPEWLMSSVPPRDDLFDRFWSGLPFVLVVDNPLSVQIARIRC